jgi:hypothetical protein
VDKKPSLLRGLSIQTVFAALLVNAIMSTLALAQNKALLIGNADYYNPANTNCPPTTPAPSGDRCLDNVFGASCPNNPSYGDLPGDVFDVLRKHNALAAVPWEVVNLCNRTKGEIIDAIKTYKPATGTYFVWYSGHGNTLGGQHGQLAGVDGLEVTAQDFVDAITDAGGNGNVASRTFVKLDSCGSGAFADAVNAINAAIGFQTAATGLDCSQGGPAGSQFTTCYVEGMNGAADAAPYGNGNGLVTVAEAAAYADVFCSFGGPQCSNNTDDDADGKVNDGCPQVGAAPEAGAQCNNNTDDDADGVVNDGCPKVGYAESKWDGDYANLVIGAPELNAGFCTVNIPGKGALCLQNLSKTDCEGKGGIWNETACIPTVSEWGLVVMAMLVLTAATVVIVRRRAMVRGGS